jgi:hypothetical protein
MAWVDWFMGLFGDNPYMRRRMNYAELFKRPVPHTPVVREQHLPPGWPNMFTPRTVFFFTGRGLGWNPEPRP